MKTPALLLLTTITVCAQVPAPAPAPDQAAAIAEIQAANQRAKAMGNPARSWLADEWTLVCFDEQMKWAMQAKIQGAATRGTFLKHGIKRTIIWNGKKAWSKDLVADGSTEPFTGPIPEPIDPMPREDLAHILPRLTKP